MRAGKYRDFGARGRFNIFGDALRDTLDPRLRSR